MGHGQPEKARGNRLAPGDVLIAAKPTCPCLKPDDVEAADTMISDAEPLDIYPANERSCLNGLESLYQDSFYFINNQKYTKGVSDVMKAWKASQTEMWNTIQEEVAEIRSEMKAENHRLEDKLNEGFLEHTNRHDTIMAMLDSLVAKVGDIQTRTTSSGFSCNIQDRTVPTPSRVPDSLGSDHVHHANPDGVNLDSRGNSSVGPLTKTHRFMESQRPTPAQNTVARLPPRPTKRGMEVREDSQALPVPTLPSTVRTMLKPRGKQVSEVEIIGPSEAACADPLPSDFRKRSPPLNKRRQECNKKGPKKLIRGTHVALYTDDPGPYTEQVAIGVIAKVPGDLIDGVILEEDLYAITVEQILHNSPETLRIAFADPNKNSPIGTLADALTGGMVLWPTTHVSDIIALSDVRTPSKKKALPQKRKRKHEAAPPPKHAYPTRQKLSAGSSPTKDEGEHTTDNEELETSEPVQHGYPTRHKSTMNLTPTKKVTTIKKDESDYENVKKDVHDDDTADIPPGIHDTDGCSEEETEEEDHIQESKKEEILHVTRKDQKKDTKEDMEKESIVTDATTSSDLNVAMKYARTFQKKFPDRNKEIMVRHWEDGRTDEVIGRARILHTYHDLILEVSESYAAINLPKYSVLLQFTEVFYGVHQKCPLPVQQSEGCITVGDVWKASSKGGKKSSTPREDELWLVWPQTALSNASTGDFFDLPDLD